MTRLLLSLSLPFLLLGGSLLSGCSSEVTASEPESEIETATEVAHIPTPTEFMPQPAMLIFSETWGWRHEEGISGGNVALMEIAAEKNMGYFTTQHSEIFNPESLSRFDLIVFNSATGNPLTRDQKEAFESWLADDGSVILIHGSMDGSQRGWTFYQEELVGPLFISHPMAPQFQDADIVVLNEGHPVTAGLPGRFTVNDEWYTFDGVPDERFITLAGLDETTYSPRNTVYGLEDLRMGDQPQDHPIIWARCLPEGGRVVASALGHAAESFDGGYHRQILSNAIDWTRKAGEDDVGCD